MSCSLLRCADPKEAYKKLARTTVTSPDAIEILVTGGAQNLTICPVCQQPKFAHIEGCSVAKELTEGV
jgi:hypothetical protein